MRPMVTGVVASMLTIVVSGGGAMAQSPYADDIACRQYADQQTAGLRAQASQAGADAVGGTLLGAGLGAAVGGGRGAAVGAASGAVAGTGAGVANAQNTEAY